MNNDKSPINVVKIIVFIIIALLIVVYSGKAIIPFNAQDTNQTKTFYKTDKNSVDILMVGTSTLMVALSPLELWKKYGFVSHVRGSSIQAPIITYLNVREAFKYQKPDLVIFSANNMFREYWYDKHEPFLRRGMDFKKLSLPKLSAARDIADKSKKQDIICFPYNKISYQME